MRTLFFILVIGGLIIGLAYTSYMLNIKYKASQYEIALLQKDISETSSQLYKGNKQVNKLEAESVTMKNYRKRSNITIAEQAERLNELQDIIQSQKNVMSNLKNLITDVLINYETDELSVYIIEGNIYVSLAEKLLFKSGSDVIDPKGIEALKSLAQVLNKTKDIHVMIEGHTDNVPIKTSLFKDNWDLSTARATAIVRVLTNVYSFDSTRITASGRGQFSPINTNETVVGRSGNRRTEVIISPNMNNLYTLLDTYE